MLRLGLMIAGVVFVADQIAKYWILGPIGFAPPGWWLDPSGANSCRDANLGCRFIELTPIFDLQMAWNRGFSFGLGRAENELGRWALVAMQLGISGVFLWWLRSAARPPTAIALRHWLLAAGLTGAPDDIGRHAVRCVAAPTERLVVRTAPRTGTAAIRDR